MLCFVENNEQQLYLSETTVTEEGICKGTAMKNNLVRAESNEEKQAVVRPEMY